MRRQESFSENMHHCIFRIIAKMGMVKQNPKNGTICYNIDKEGVRDIIALFWAIEFYGGSSSVGQSTGLWFRGSRVQIPSLTLFSYLVLRCAYVVKKNYMKTRTER